MSFPQQTRLLKTVPQIINIRDKLRCRLDEGNMAKHGILKNSHPSYMLWLCEHRLSLHLTSSAGGYKANSSGCLFPCRASWLKRSSSSWLLQASSPSTLWSGVKHRKSKSEDVSVRPESSLRSARVGDLTWGKDRGRRVRVMTGKGWGRKEIKYRKIWGY